MSTTLQRLKIEAQRKKDNRRTPLLKKCPHSRGWVNRATIVTPRKPNSAKRPVVKIFVRKGGRMTAHIPGIGHNLKKYTKVLTRGKGPRDLPGVRYSCVRGVLDFVGLKKKKRRRSIYGAPQNNMLKIRARRKYRHAIRKAENIRIFDEDIDSRYALYKKLVKRVIKQDQKIFKENAILGLFFKKKNQLIFFKNIILFSFFKKPLKFNYHYFVDVKNSNFSHVVFRANKFANSFMRPLMFDSNFLLKFFSFLFFFFSEHLFFFKNANFITFFKKKSFYNNMKINISLFDKFFLCNSYKKQNVKTTNFCINAWTKQYLVYESGLYRCSPFFFLYKKKKKKYFLIKRPKFLSKKERLNELYLIEDKHKNIKILKQDKKKKIVNYFFYFKIYRKIKKKYIFEKNLYLQNKNKFKFFINNKQKKKLINIRKYLYFYFFKPLIFFKRQKKQLILFNKVFDLKFYSNSPTKMLYKYIRYVFLKKTINKKIKKTINKKKYFFNNNSFKRFNNKLKNL